VRASIPALTFNNFDTLQRRPMPQAPSPRSRECVVDKGESISLGGWAPGVVQSRRHTGTAHRLAYSVDQSTVLRGGYGIYYGQWDIGAACHQRFNGPRTCSTLDSGPDLVATSASISNGFSAAYWGGQMIRFGAGPQNPSSYNPDIQASRSRSGNRRPTELPALSGGSRLHSTKPTNS